MTVLVNNNRNNCFIELFSTEIFLPCFNPQGLSLRQPKGLISTAEDSWSFQTIFQPPSGA